MVNPRIQRLPTITGTTINSRQSEPEKDLSGAGRSSIRQTRQAPTGRQPREDIHGQFADMTTNLPKDSRLPTQEFLLDTGAGGLSATLNYAKAASHALLLAHGAGADHQHTHMSSLADAFEKQGFTTLRFNFPFKQQGRNRVDSKALSIDCIIEAATWLQNNHSLPLLVGGHSYGGRMATHAVFEQSLDCEALVMCSFPLHPAGKPSTDRSVHLKDITQPMIFLSGTRDALAEQNLLTGVANTLNPKNKLHWLETGDHSFKILKRTRTNPINIYEEAATATREFIDAL